MTRPSEPATLIEAEAVSRSTPRETASAVSRGEIVGMWREWWNEQKIITQQQRNNGRDQRSVGWGNNDEGTGFHRTQDLCRVCDHNKAVWGGYCYNHAPMCGECGNFGHTFMGLCSLCQQKKCWCGAWKQYYNRDCGNHGRPN